MFTDFAYGLSAVLAAVALPHLAGLLRATYVRWQYPPGFARATGSLLLAAALCLLLPWTRLVGLGLAALVLFLTATTLLHRRQYAYAAPVIALLFALVPVSLGA